MSVYVDQSDKPFGWMIMCHMMADTLEELHAMADKIGVQRKWFQDHKDHPHYDISKKKRLLAVQNGAIELSNVEMVEWNQKRRIAAQPIRPLMRDGMQWCGNPGWSKDMYPCDFCDDETNYGDCDICHGSRDIEGICCQFHADELQLSTPSPEGW